MSNKRSFFERAAIYLGMKETPVFQIWSADGYANMNDWEQNTRDHEVLCAKLREHFLKTRNDFHDVLFAENKQDTYSGDYIVALVRSEKDEHGETILRFADKRFYDAEQIDEMLGFDTIPAKPEAEPQSFIPRSKVTGRTIT